MFPTQDNSLNSSKFIVKLPAWLMQESSWNVVLSKNFYQEPCNFNCRFSSSSQALNIDWSIPASCSFLIAFLPLIFELIFLHVFNLQNG